MSSCVSSYSSPDWWLFPILSLLSSHHSSLFRVLDLGAASLLLGLFGLSFVLIFSLLILALSLSIFYELFCYPFSSLSFGFDLCHLDFRRPSCLLMHCYVFSLAGCFHAYFLDVFPVGLSFHFLIVFMTLTFVLGCFPLDLGPYRSKSVYPLS